MSKYHTYNSLLNPVTSFEGLQGRILTRVNQVDDDEIHFHLTDAHYVRMHHQQDCCECVTIEDIAGDLDDLVGTPLIMVEEVNNYDMGNQDDLDEYSDSETWTYYRFRTMKGDVSIRWHGSSDGYYSESVDIEIVGSE